MQTFAVKTARRAQFVDITGHVRRAVAESGVRSGVCHVYVPHTTAGVTINENADPDVVTDMLAHLEKLVPQSPSFRHAEGNSDAHIKASMMGFAASIPVEDGAVVLGRWQGVYFCEFDGPRNRNVQIQVVTAK